jgi:hypothetical protein
LPVVARAACVERERDVPRRCRALIAGDVHYVSYGGRLSERCAHDARSRPDCRRDHRRGTGDNREWFARSARRWVGPVAQVISHEVVGPGREPLER